MIKSTVHRKTLSKSGAIVKTGFGAGTGSGLYGSHNKGTIRPAHKSTKSTPPCFGRKSGRDQIKTTGGC